MFYSPRPPVQIAWVLNTTEFKDKKAFLLKSIIRLQNFATLVGCEMVSCF